MLAALKTVCTENEMIKNDHVHMYASKSQTAKSLCKSKKERYDKPEVGYLKTVRG